MKISSPRTTAFISAIAGKIPAAAGTAPAVRRSLVLLLLACAASHLVAQTAPDPAGRWSGAVQVPGQALNVVVLLARGDDGALKGTIDIPQQGASGLALANVSATGEEVAFTIEGVPGNPTFKGKISVDGAALSGTFLQGGAKFPFSLARETEAERQAAATATSSALEEIRTFIPEAMKQWDVPGLSVAIVRNGEVIFSEGFGYRDMERKLPVNPQTMFAIGSSTKAFTSFIVGSLVDDGTLQWDTPVADYLPAFHLQDECATKLITPRDLLLHISGLPRHDVMWYGSSLTRDQLFERLRYLEPSAGFRSEWQYQNLMYMTAGYLAGKVAGTTWEDLVQKRIFDPLGMRRSNFSVAGMERDSNAALPYREKDEKMARLPYRSLDQIGPAGSINSTAEDMARWVKLHLGRGSYDGREVISEGTLSLLHTPQVVISGAAGSSKELLFNLYAMGWFVQSYRGHRLVHHGGNIDGFTALVSMMPDDSTGVVILTNQDGSALPMAAMLTIYDRLLGFEKVDWSGKMKGRVTGAEEMVKQNENRKDVDRIPGTVPSHRLEAYAGEYESPAYGVIRVSVERDRLKVAFNDMSSPLEHFHYDVFRAAEMPEPFAGLKLQFQANIRGTIDRLLVPLEPSASDIVFTRRAPSSMTDPAALQEYAGEYNLAGARVLVEVIGTTLALTVPGQPRYQLQPLADGEFGLKGVNGYAVRFEREKGKVVRALFLQPNGTFAATKK